jgi:hypothetical protein
MLRKLISNSPRLKNFMLWFGVNNYSNTIDQFTPYFHYTIGKPKEDYGLYFHKQPSSWQYHANIFLRLGAYRPHEAIKYLEYHYDLYPDKKDFLLFVQRNLQFRISNTRTDRDLPWLIISRQSLKWTEEKLLELENDKEIQSIDEFINKGLPELVKNELNKKLTIDDRALVGRFPDQDLVDPLTDQARVDQLAEKIYDHIKDPVKERMEGIMIEYENKMMRLADQHETGNIHLTNISHKEKLITLFLCLKDLSGKSKGRNKAGELLFSEMSLTDIAMILRLHFAQFKNIKVGSIEKQIYEVNTNREMDDPEFMELSRALQKFFF